MEAVNFWHWFVAGALFITLEIFTLTFFLLWLGIGAIVTGIALLLWPGMSPEGQFLVFAVASTVSAFCGRGYLKAKLGGKSHPTLNQRGSQYVGRTFTLDDPIENGFGKIHVDDTFWKIAGADCPAGTRVKVSAVEGVVLQVEVAGHGPEP